MTAAVRVHLDGAGVTSRVGMAYVAARRGVTTTRFDYDQTYLATPGAWSVSPDLPIVHGASSTAGLPGALADCAPDRWGRNLIAKALRARERRDGTTPSTVTDVDYLLGVSDVTRQGALRFSVGDDPTFLAERTDVPKLLGLPSLLRAANTVANDGDDGAVGQLLEAGSASLGGARPKASVIDAGRLHIAKFPHGDDGWNVMAWEMTALDLAASCGLATPPHRLLRLGSDHVLLLERFDRSEGARIPYVSAMTLIGRSDGTDADYLDLAEAITEHGSDVGHDLQELWRRIAFSLAINNTDDHMRNHGFLRVRNGWKLAPVFDINPDPDPGAARVTSIDGATARPEAADALIGAAEWFGMTVDEARACWDDIRQHVGAWDHIAARNDIAEGERRRFSEIFDRL